MTIEIVSSIPILDEHIMAGTPFEFKIKGKLYRINQLTYKDYNVIREWLIPQGLDLLGYPPKNLFEQDKVKAEVQKIIQIDNQKIHCLVDLLCYFIQPETKWTNRWITKKLLNRKLRKLLFNHCYMSDLFYLLETLLRFNFVIKKKLVCIIKTSPEQYQADHFSSEITGGMSSELSKLVKSGILIPRFYN